MDKSQKPSKYKKDLETPADSDKRKVERELRGKGEVGRWKLIWCRTFNRLDSSAAAGLG